MVLPLISASYSYTLFISLFSMLHMISIFLQIVKKGLVSGLVWLSIVVILSLTWSLMLRPSKSSRSALRPRSPKDPNKRLVDAGGEEDHQSHSKPTKHPTLVPDDEKSALPATPTVYIKSRHDDGPTSRKPLPEFNPDDLVRRTFLLPPGDNGERLRAKATRKMVEDIDQADGERVQNTASYLVLAMENWKRSYPITNLWIIWKLQPMKTTRSVMI